MNKQRLMKMVWIGGMLPALLYAGDSTSASNNGISRQFTDVPETHWSYKAVQTMAGKQIVEGYTDGSFKPGQIVTRAEFAAMLFKAARLQQGDAGAGQPTFSDVHPSAWYKPFAEGLKGYFVRNGVQEETDRFAPDEPALREDVAAAIVRVKGWSGNQAPSLKERFKDYDTVSTSAAQDLAAAVERGIVSGYEDGTIRGKAALSRAEAAVMLAKAFQDEAAQTSANSSEPQSGTSSELANKPDLNVLASPKPHYAIVDTLAIDVGVAYKDGNADRYSQYIGNAGTKVEHEITELASDAEGNIYFIETQYYKGIPASTVYRLDKQGGTVIQAFKLGDAFITKVDDPVTGTAKEYKPFSSGLAPVKLLWSTVNTELQMAANWLNPEFLSVYSLKEQGKLLGYAKQGRKLARQDFIVQLAGGDFIYSDVKSGTVHRTKPGESESDWEVKVSFSGKQLSALVQDQALYVMDTGSKLLIKIDINSKAVLASFPVHADGIKYAAAKQNRFYFSTGRNIYTLDLNGTVEPYMDADQFVYNGVSFNLPAKPKDNSFLRANYPTVNAADISAFTFDLSGNLIFFDEELRNIRRLRFVTDSTQKQAPVPVILPAGPKLETPKTEVIAENTGIQEKQPVNMVDSMITDEEGNLYISEANRPVRKRDEKSTLTEDWGDRSLGGLYFSDRENTVYQSDWDRELQIATINELWPDKLTVGYMKGREMLARQDFVVSDGTGVLTVSDVREGNLWAIGKDRQGKLMSPVEVGKHIRFSGGTTAAFWKEQKLYILDAGNKTVTELEVDGLKYRARTLSLKINGSIDALCVYGDKFYALSGTNLYHIGANGDILLKEDLSKLLSDNSPVINISMDSKGRLFVLDQKGMLQRIHFYGN